MANEYFDLNIRVKATSEDAALELVKRQLGDVNAKLKETKDSSDTLAGSVKQMVATFLTLEGARKVVEYFWKGMKDAAQEAREMRGIGAILKDIGADAEKGAAQVDAFANRMKDAGFADEQTRASLMKLLPVTRDLDASIGLLDVAYGQNIVRGKDVNATIDLMASLLIGGPRSLRTAQLEYGVVLDQNMPKQDQFKEAMRQIIAQGAGVADKTRDATARIASLGIIMGDIQKGVGARFLAQINNIGGAFGWGSQKVAEFGVNVVSALGRLSIALATVGQSEVLMWIMGKKAAKADAAPKMPDLMSGHSKGSWLNDMLNFRPPAGTAGSNGEAESAQKLADAYRDLATAEAEEARQKMLAASTSERADAAFSDAYRKRIEQTNFEQRAMQAAYQKDVTQTGLSLKAKDALHDKYVVDIMKSESKLKADLSKLGDDLLKVYVKDDKDRERLREQTLKRLEADELEAERKRQTNSQKFDDLHKKKELSMRAGELKAMRQELLTELMDLRTSEQRKHELLKQFAQLNTEIAKEESKAKRDLYLQTAADALMAASEAFGNNKALAIASTIISTYQSAQQSYEAMSSIPYVGPALGIAAAAAAIAAGMARVQQISSATPPGAAKGAYLSGATNLIAGEAGDELVLPNKYTRMFDRIATREASMGSTTIHNRQRGGDTIVNQTLLTGAHADYAFRQLDRKLRTARRQNDRAMLAPPVNRIGSKRTVP
jgi:hypothetical protein